MADRADPEQRLLADITERVSLMLRGEQVSGHEKLAGVRVLALSEELRHEPRALLIMALSVGFSGEIGDDVATGSAPARCRRHPGLDPGHSCGRPRVAPRRGVRRPGSSR